MPEVEYKITWNKTSIEQAVTCMMQFYLINIEKVRFPTTGNLVFGSFIHHIIDKLFFNEEGKPRYKTAESFANAVAGKKDEAGKLRGGMWNRAIKNDFYRGRKIRWRSREEPYILRRRLWNLCHGIYQRFVDEGPPLYSELEFNLGINGKSFNGRIDQIRVTEKGPVIRDFKSGRFALGDMMKHYDPQFTLYSLAVGAMCHADRNFARSIGISDIDAEIFPKDPSAITKKINLEYYLLEQNEVIRVERDTASYVDFLMMIDSKERQLNSGEISVERGKHCDTCLVREECDRRTAGQINPIYNTFQPDFFSLNFKPPISKDENKNLRIRQPRIKFK